MDKKKIGIVILVIGLVMNLNTGYNYVTQEKAIDMGGVQLTLHNNHSTYWSALIGLGLMLIGFGISL